MACCSRKHNPVGAARRHHRLGAALRSAALSLSVLSCAALASCEPAGEVGLDVLPDDVPATATYTELYARAATVLRTDSVLTANKGTVLTGELLDTNVGRTTAESYWQVRPATINPAVPLVDATVDSLVLSYSFSQFNGTANDRLSLEAYELTEGFAEDKSYYADSPGLTLGPKLGESSFKLRFALVRSNVKVPAYPWLIGDTTRKWADSVRVLRPLRFPVVGSSGDALKQRLLAAIGKTENLSLVNFQAVLKGVALKPKSGTTGAIIGFDPKASDTRLTLYYHLPIPIDTLGQPSRVFVYSLGDAAQERYFTRITTDFNAGEHLKSFAVPAPTAAADTVAAGTATSFTAYLQGGLELGTYIRLSGFEPLLAKKGRIAINRAELFIPVKPYAAGVYSVPAQAFLAEVDARNQILKTNGQMRLVQTSGVDPNDITRPAVATYDATLRAYRVVLTSYLDARLNNKLIDQKGDAFLLLPSLPALNSVSLSRALIDGARGQIKLKVYYSELN